MRIYLDACCLHRPLDDQSQERIRLESEAVRLVLEMCSAQVHRWVSSEVLEDELRRNPDSVRRNLVMHLLRFADDRLMVDENSTALARTFAGQGIGAADALHLAVAEIGGCDILLTADEKFVRRARALNPLPRVAVENPTRWVLENVKHGA